MISREEVRHIAKLARLGLTEDEVEKFQKDLSSILDYVEKLKEVNVQNVEPTSQALLGENVARKDEEKAKALNSRLISLAPETNDGYIKVKRVFK